MPETLIFGGAESNAIIGAFHAEAALSDSASLSKYHPFGLYHGVFAKLSGLAKLAFVFATVGLLCAGRWARQCNPRACVMTQMGNALWLRIVTVSLER